jgi:2-oxo-4-hydroxy-4-carboxy-5-ureidoimidazoline decarboxylase
VPYPDLGDDDEVGVENVQNQSPGVQAFNTRPEHEVRATLSTCLGVPRWVEEVTASRPYADEDAVLAQADASARSLSEQEVAAALARHSRIGERPTADDRESRFSSREQSGVDGTDREMTQRLAVGNAAYEARFGRVFLIRAKGRDTREILAELERRLRNDQQTEEKEVVDQLREIAVLRLQGVLGQ